MTDPRSFLHSLFSEKPGDAYVLIWTLADKRSHWFREIDRAAADGPRYKAIGNSMAVPVMRWIGSRIQMVEEKCS